jgi:tRNA-uridine 2-sulfurtransferase
VSRQGDDGQFRQTRTVVTDDSFPDNPIASRVAGRGRPVIAVDSMTLNPSTVVVALSGGLDSSFAAALLLDQGWHVRGLHLLLPADPGVREARRESVLAVSGFLGIPLEFLDMTGKFDARVVAPFVSRYLNGLTPNPCVVCNEEIKFPALCGYAESINADFVATGHYAMIDRTGGAAHLLRGFDQQKDQSYFLHRLDPGHLNRSVFPVGALTKEYCRSEAVTLGLTSPCLPESQEICFLHEEDYRGLVERGAAGVGASGAGKFVTESGEVLGSHRGIHRFTIGQRHGMGIASERPYYVKALNPARGEVVIGRREEIFSREVRVSGFKWLIRPEGDMRLHAQIRYRHKAAPGLLQMLGRGRVCFTFDEPQWAVTPGQALVCYDREVVVGGGWISPP